MPLPVFGQSPSKTTETLRLLRHLARQNVYAHLPLSCAGESSGGRENFELIRLGKDDEANILATMELGTLKKAAKAGWVIEEKSNRCIDDCEPGLWRLSNAGRLHLKRALTRNKPVDQTAKSRPPAAAVHPAPQTNDSESPLAWLRRRKDKTGRPMISQAQFDAGEKLRADFYYAQMMPRMTTNWSAVGSDRSARRGAPMQELEMQEYIVAARERVRQALSSVGPELSSILIDVCCHLKGLERAEGAAGWPKRSGKLVLQLALSSLARHYGLTRAVDPLDRALACAGGHKTANE